MPSRFFIRDKRRRFVVTLTALLAVGFVATSLVSYYVAHDSLTEQIAENTLPLTSDNIYSEIQQDLLRPIFISSLMARDTFVRDWTLSGEEDEAKIVKYLQEIQKRYGTVTSFFVSERTRKYYHSTGVLKTVAQEDPQDAWYFRVRNMNKDFEINVDRDTANLTSLSIFVNYRVYDYAGHYIGATGVGLAVNAVKNRIEAYQKRYGRRIFFTDRQGIVTMHGPDYNGARDIHETPGLSAYATQILASPSGSFSYQREGREVFVNSRLVPEFQWYLLVEQEGAPGQTRLVRTLLGNLLVCLVITAIVLVFANLTIGGYQRNLETMATTDKLTGAANRQVFGMMFDHVVKTLKRSDGPVSVIFIDIDSFKEINDGHGHPAGDAVIQYVAGTARSQVRESDSIFRWGGDEFLLLLPDCDIQHAARNADRIRQKIAEMPVYFGSVAIPVTVSIGVAQLAKRESQDSLVERADRALYLAKQEGRDRVHVAV